MTSTIYELRENEGPELKKRAVYSLPPKKAIVCYIEQVLFHNTNTWDYPEEIEGMRQSSTVADHWYFDEFRDRHGVNGVLAAYPDA